MVGSDGPNLAILEWPPYRPRIAPAPGFRGRPGVVADVSYLGAARPHRDR